MFFFFCLFSSAFFVFIFSNIEQDASPCRGLFSTFLSRIVTGGEQGTEDDCFVFLLSMQGRHIIGASSFLYLFTQGAHPFLCLQGILISTVGDPSMLRDSHISHQGLHEMEEENDGPSSKSSYWQFSFSYLTSTALNYSSLVINAYGRRKRRRRDCRPAVLKSILASVSPSRRLEEEDEGDAWCNF